MTQLCTVSYSPCSMQHHGTLLIAQQTLIQGDNNAMFIIIIRESNLQTILCYPVHYTVYIKQKRSCVAKTSQNNKQTIKPTNNSLNSSKTPFGIEQLNITFQSSY